MSTAGELNELLRTYWYRASRGGINPTPQEAFDALEARVLAVAEERDQLAAELAEIRPATTTPTTAAGTPLHGMEIR